MRVNRLLEMVTLLLNRQTITAGEFAERFNISVRTVYRDVEDLSSAGIPVYMSKGKGGGISLLEDFTLNKTLISRQETDSLLLALRTLQAVKYPDVDRFLEKLQSLFHTSAPSD
jgi:predicted DNA-binding transcriptional regulator YafY